MTGDTDNLCRAILKDRRMPYLAALLAVVLALPGVWTGWQLDDHLQRLVMLGPPYSSYEPMDLFGIANGNPELTREYKDQGIVPFWTSPGFRLSFFRPLTVLTVWLDYQLWPASPSLMHLHSILWFAALIIASGYLFRSLFGAGWIAGLATLLNAADPTRALPALWISSRHVLISTFFGVLFLLWHDRWRRGGWKLGSFLAPLALALALLAGEMGLAAVGYLVAHALFVDGAHRRSRATAMVPSLCVVFSWFLIYSIGGYGSAGSGTYHDPMTDFWIFLGSLVTHAPLLLAAEWSSLPADLANVVPADQHATVLLACLLVVVGVVLALLRTIRTSSLARFWSVGMLLSLAPIAATFPSGRLLSFVALGAAGLLAVYLGRLVERFSSVKAGSFHCSLVHAAVVLVLALKLAIAPLLIPVAAWLLDSIDDSMMEAISTVPDDDQISGQDLVILNPPDQLYYGAYIPVVKRLQGKPAPGRIKVLAAGPTEMEVLRVDSSTIRVRISAGLFSGPFGRSFRSTSTPMHRGEEIRISGMSTVVQEVDSNGDPTEMLFRFSHSLGDGRLRLLRWENGAGYVTFVPPPIGETVALPPARTQFNIF